MEEIRVWMEDVSLMDEDVRLAQKLMVHQMEKLEQQGKP